MPAEAHHTRSSTIEGATLLIPTANLIGGPETDELEAFVTEADQAGVSTIVFDMTEVLFSNTVGLQVLVGAYLRLSKRGGRVLVFGLQPRVRHLFDVVRLDQLIERCETREEATASVRDGKRPDGAR
jgi:anti-sigma B factor antagonist